MAKTIAQRIRHFSPKTYWKELIAVLVILLAFVFFRNERKELAAIIPHLRAANLTWVWSALELLSSILYFRD